MFGYCQPISLVKDITGVEKKPGRRPGQPSSKPLKDIVLKAVTIHRGEKPQ